MSTCNAQDPIEYRKHDVHHYYLRHGELVHRHDDYIIDSQKDLTIVTKKVSDESKIYSKIADNGTCYTMERYYVPWLGDWYSFFCKTEIYDMSSKGTVYKIISDGWDGFIDVNNCGDIDPSTYYYVDYQGNVGYVSYVVRYGW